MEKASFLDLFIFLFLFPFFFWIGDWGIGGLGRTEAKKTRWGDQRLLRSAIDEIN